MTNILIVDDQNLKAYQGLLEEEFTECNIIGKRSQEEAMATLESESIDILITDLIMENDDSGIQLLKYAKLKDPSSMVIIITAYEKRIDRREAFRLGAFDCLIKGVAGVKTHDELIYKTRNALYMRRFATDFLRRFFDQNVFIKLRENPDLLIPKQRVITVVSWDIRGFSSLAESLKSDGKWSELISGFLKEFFEVASNTVFQFGGVLDKFIGDGVMALFGCFDDDNRESENKNAIAAIEAALHLRSEFLKIKTKWMKEWSFHVAGNVDIGLGCGMHTGQALVGNLGTEVRDHFTAVGPHVNFTFRIENTAQKGEIRFSSTTKGRIDSRYNVKKIDTLKNIKHIDGEFDIYTIQD